MRFTFREEINKENLIIDLCDEYPDYKVSLYGNNKIEVRKDDTTAAFLIVKKNVLDVNGGIPENGMRVLFIVIAILFGLIIPFIIYGLAFKPEQTKFAKEVDEFIVRRSKKPNESTEE
ncbi:MAG: hypothetical protein NXI10_14665 [bacterium]|nr:hypothetical protein [bacterium]